MLSLERLDESKFEELLTQWRPHFDNNEELLYEHCRPHLEHAKRIMCEDPPDPRYGIYGLVRNLSERIYEGFTHVNHNKPGSEVRLVWNTLHPKYENELTPAALAEFTFCYISEAISLAKGPMTAKAVRIYLHNATDRQYAQGIVTYLQQTHVSRGVTNGTLSLVGNWLHIGDVTGLVL